MKELSIEEKAKRYDEAIKKLRSLHEDYDTVSTLIDVKEELEDIFPELAEPDDERIRKSLKDCFEWLRDDARWTDVYGSSFESVFAWLEKQGEPKEINPSEFDSQLNRLLKQFESLSKEELASSLSFYLNVVQNDGTYKSDKKQGEQKPADKVEPKFKVGDIITNGILIGEIDEIHEWGYHAYFGDHYADIPDVENWHKWTIQDAKANAGYEGNADKKELKKIEQKSTIIPKFKVGDIIRHKEQGFTCKIIAVDTEYRLSGCNGNHLPFDSQDAYELVEQKPAEWTKEDKERYISCLQKLSTGNPEQPETINSKWFKEHVYSKPQSTWRPSDRQIEILKDFLFHIPIEVPEKVVLVSLYHDLLKLKE